MISIGKQYLDAALEQILATLRPYRGVRADGHKGGREYFVVTRTESSGARPRARCRGFEGEIQPLHVGAGYRLALRKGRFAARDAKLEVLCRGHWFHWGSSPGAARTSTISPAR